MLARRCPWPTLKVVLASVVVLFGVLQELKPANIIIPGAGAGAGDKFKVMDEISPGYTSCTIPTEDRISCEKFAEAYVGTKPVILKGLTQRMSSFANKCARDALLESRRYGSLVVNVSTANAFTGRSLKEVTVSEYLRNMLLPQDVNKHGNETYYLFGGHHGTLWKEFLDDYRIPPFPTESLRSTLKQDSQVSDELLCAEVEQLITSLSFGIAGKNTGVPFHFHGPGFLQVIHGRKRWLLYPPGTHLPSYEPNVTTYTWVSQILPHLEPHQRPYDCILGSGDVVYFPSQWLHATLNLDDYNVFVSTFA